MTLVDLGSNKTKFKKVEHSETINVTPARVLQNILLGEDRVSENVWCTILSSLFTGMCLSRAKYTSLHQSIFTRVRYSLTREENLG